MDVSSSIITGKANNNINSPSNALSETLVMFDNNVENDDSSETVQAEGNKELENKSIELRGRKAIIFVILIPFSIVGVLIRIGLIDLHSYPGPPVFSLIYPQFVGCVIMGFCLAKGAFIKER